MATKPLSQRARELEKRRRQQLQRNRDNWARRHRALAAEESALKRQNKAVRRDYGHKVNGTPETHAKAARVQQGALARLFMSGAIDAHQLASAQEIRAVHERIGADVAVGTVSLETRVDTSRAFDGTFFEKLGAVRAEVAYTRWRSELRGEGLIALAVIVEDLGIEEARRRYRLGRPKAKKLLIDALDRWAEIIGTVCKEVDEATVLAAHAGIL